MIITIVASQQHCQQLHVQLQGHDKVCLATLRPNGRRCPRDSGASPEKWLSSRSHWAMFSVPRPRTPHQSLGSRGREHLVAPALRPSTTRPSDVCDCDCAIVDLPKPGLPTIRYTTPRCQASLLIDPTVRLWSENIVIFSHFNVTYWCSVSATRLVYFEAGGVGWASRRIAVITAIIRAAAACFMF